MNVRTGTDATEITRRCCQRQKCAERSLVATCFHPTTEAKTVATGGGPPKNRFAETKLACSRRTHPPSHPQSSRYTPRCPSSCCERRVAVWSGVCSSRHQGLDKARRKQPANLAVEGTEESLSILPDYKPTVRPPPKRC
jgi:hypothetical protein